MLVQPIQGDEKVKKSWEMPGAGTDFQVNQTLWGYVLLSEYTEKPIRTMFTMTRQVIGTLLLISAFSMWVFPQAVPGAEIVGMKLGLTVLYAVIAFLFLYRPQVSVCREVQVDVNRAELRAGFRNEQGMFHLESVHAFDTVSVVSLCTGKGKVGNAGLLLRIEETDVALVAARGPQGDMEETRLRLAMDLGASTGKFNPIALAACEGPGLMVLGPRIGGEAVAA